jgi:hypothetical protein
MSWYYRDWNTLEDLIMVVTVLLAVATLVAALVALVRSHRHVPARSAVAMGSGRHLASSGSSLHPHEHNGHRAA